MQTKHITSSEWGDFPLPEIRSEFDDPRFKQLHGIVLDRQDHYSYEADLIGKEEITGFTLTTQA